jgi:hypothetical protein
VDFKKQARLKVYFPNLYRLLAEKTDSLPQPIQLFGIECRNGWYDLIYNLSAVLERYILTLPEASRQHFYASQVKEKWGSLSYYTSLYCENQQVIEAFAEAGEASKVTCEVCGEKGELHGDLLWKQTLCDKHLKAYLTTLHG